MSPTINVYVCTDDYPVREVLGSTSARRLLHRRRLPLASGLRL